MNLAGSYGTVTVAIRPPQAGEVKLNCNGGTQRVVAYASEEVPLDALVVVLDERPGGVEVGKTN